MTHQNSYLRKKYNNSEKSYEYQARRNRAAFGRWLLIGAAFLFVVYLFNFRSVNDTMTVLSYDGPQAMRELASGSGLNTHGMALFYEAQPQYVDADVMSTKCPREEEVVLFGCYTPNDNRIYILQMPEGFRDAEYSTAAHETLHAAWSRETSASQQAELRAEFDRFFAEYPNQEKIIDTLKYYDEEDEYSYSSEMHSLLGAEASGLSPTLREYFSKYFTSRDESVAHHQAFNDRFEGTVAELNSRAQQLNITKAELDVYKRDHLDSFDYYFNLALRYGDYYNYNQNVRAYNNNLEIYNGRVDAYNAQLESYRADYDAFMRVYNSLFPTKEAPVTNV